jgi:thioredoxin 1
LENDEELDRIREEKRKELIHKISEVSEKKTGSVVALNDSSFDATLKTADLPVLVDFWAEWCFPCRMMAPVVEDLAHDYAGKADFAKLNVDENPEIASRYEVMSIPLFIIFKDGKPVERVIGAVGKGPLESALKRHL